LQATLDTSTCLAPTGFRGHSSASTPSGIVKKLNGEIGRALKDPDFAAQISAIGIDPIGSTPEEFAAFLRKEIPRWKQIVQDGEVKVEGDR
jgi:tripartite-type tricarboxylate transporter receptor subunit TctC